VIDLAAPADVPIAPLAPFRIGQEEADRFAQENPGLQAFVFFTNVDLTPTQKDDLIAYAKSKNVREADVFDMERLRHALDSPAGLLVREQYLDIPMTPERKPTVEFQGFKQVRANFGTLHKMQFRITGGDPSSEAAGEDWEVLNRDCE
jgi:hypothetical protein